MTLGEFIEKVKLEHNIPYPGGDIQTYILKKAKEKAVQNVAAVDDETVKQWILEYKPEEKKDSKVPTVEELKALKRPEVEKPAGITEKKEEEWGEQQSLF